MADGRERLGPAGLSSVSRRQRERRYDRNQQLQRAKVMRALTAAAVVMVCVVTSVVVAHTHTPWGEHEEDLEEGSSSRSSSSDDDTTLASKATRPTSDKGKGKDGGAGKRKNVHRAAARKAHGREYIRWSLTLLQRACAHRSISKMSTEKRKEVLVDALRAQDNAMKRPSPFFEDLHAIVDGGTPCTVPVAPKEEAGQPPQQLIDVYRAALKVGVNDPPGKLHGWQGQSFTSAALLTAIKEEDAEADAESTPSARKSIHCVPRFCELIADERYRQMYATINSKMQLTRQELDRKETGKKRNVVVEIWEA